MLCNNSKGHHVLQLTCLKMRKTSSAVRLAECTLFLEKEAQLLPVNRFDLILSFRHALW